MTYFFLSDENFELSDDQSILTIINVQEPQNGVYKCLTEENTVINAFDVDSKFKLKKLAASQSVDDGVPTEIECSLKAVSFTNYITYILHLISKYE